jgi:predicted ribosomally synthesized peptide with nif11-like leader
MSSESAKAFLEKLDSDASLRSELFASEDENAERVAVSAQRLAELAAQHGFDVSPEEMREACIRQGRQGRSSSGELADAELDAVAGGAAHVSNFYFTKYFDTSTPTLG